MWVKNSFDIVVMRKNLPLYALPSYVETLITILLLVSVIKMHNRNTLYLCYKIRIKLLTKYLNLFGIGILYFFFKTAI